jgi:enoyl-CoA hydratase
VDAHRALQVGLVTEVVAHDDLVAAAQRLATTIAANNRPAVMALHESYRRIEADVSDGGLGLELDAARKWRRSGQTSGIGDRVSGVISRGRDQAGADH